MSKGGRFHGRAEREREREGSPLAEILRPRAIICPAGLFRLLARGWSPYLHTRPIYSIRRLPYQRFSIPVYIVFHRVRAHTRAQSYQLHARGASRGGAKLTRRRRKKRRRLGERKEREKKGKKANIKMCKWRHDILEKRSILTKSIHERESSHTFPCFSVLPAVVPVRHVFSATFLRPVPQPLPSSSLGSYLIRGSLIRTRGREWAAKDPFLSLSAALDLFPS